MTCREGLVRMSSVTDTDNITNRDSNSLIKIEIIPMRNDLLHEKDSDNKPGIRA